MDHKPRVLVVDDDEDMLMLLDVTLRATCDVSTAGDGEQAWKMLDSDDHVPDLVICDLNMPKMSGDQLVERMRGDRRLTSVPVILLTGNDTDEARMGMLEIGISDYVLKPFPPGELRLRVRNILRNTELLREVERARMETEAVNRELREVNLELDRFAAAAAHDLQAPLANIAGYAHLMADDVVTDEVRRKQLLGAIAENTDRAIVLVRDLLQHARTIASSDEVDIVDLVSVVSEACLHLESMLDETGGQVIVLDSPPPVLGRRAGIESMMRNLLSNSLKYRREDRPPVIEVRAALARDPGFVEVTVRDNGLGIDAADRERVFGLGVRGRDNLTGTGIGLATVRAVVARHGGSIALDDNLPRGGLVVRFTLPTA